MSPGTQGVTYAAPSNRSRPSDPNMRTAAATGSRHRGSLRKLYGPSRAPSSSNAPRARTTSHHPSPPYAPAASIVGHMRVPRPLAHRLRQYSIPLSTDLSASRIFPLRVDRQGRLEHLDVLPARIRLLPSPKAQAGGFTTLHGSLINLRPRKSAPQSSAPRLNSKRAIGSGCQSWRKESLYAVHSGVRR